MMFVDASAAVAILMNEAEGVRVSRALSQADRAITSPVALWETTTALIRIGQHSPAEAKAAIEQFLKFARISVVDIGLKEFELAHEAHSRFGKGRHPARLNLGDCFAYAAARANKAEMLATGEDFGQTDLPMANY